MVIHMPKMKILCIMRCLISVVMVFRHMVLCDLYGRITRIILAHQHEDRRRDRPQPSIPSAHGGGLLEDLVECIKLIFWIV